MTILFTKHAKTSMLLPKLCESEPKSYVNGLRISNDRSNQKCFPVNFVEFLRTPFLTEHLWVTASGMKGNTDMYHLILSTGDSNQIQIGNSLWHSL